MSELGSPSTSSSGSPPPSTSPPTSKSWPPPPSSGASNGPTPPSSNAEKSPKVRPPSAPQPPPPPPPSAPQPPPPSTPPPPSRQSPPQQSSPPRSPPTQQPPPQPPSTPSQQPSQSSSAQLPPSPSLPPPTTTNPPYPPSPSLPPPTTTNPPSPPSPSRPSSDSSGSSPSRDSSGSSNPSSDFSRNSNPSSDSLGSSSPSSDSSGSSPSPPQSPAPPSSEATSNAPAAPDSTSTASPAVSPPSINQSATTPTGLPQAAAPPSPPSPPNSRETPSSSGGASFHSEGSDNSSKNDSHNQKNGVVAGVVVGGVLFIIALVGLFLYLRKRRKKKQGKSQSNNYIAPPANFSVTTGGNQGGESFSSPGSGIIATSKQFFTYQDLMGITNGFSCQNVIGEGGFGCVYKGWLPDGKLVAVKQLKTGSGQGEREFRAEVEIISRVHHRHLVSLVGYCIAENQRLLIYEFVPNKTLEYHLHSKQLPVLEWSKRVKIATGAAKGLAYLHEDCHPRIIHRDIKSANILLEDDFEAQVADFGLARLNDTSQSHVSTRVMGTIGYLAPEYATSGKLTDRSDVFSFGVVLLELITGRKPVDLTQPLGDESLVEWARPLLIKALESSDFSQLADPRLGKDYVESEMFRMIKAAAACVRHSAAKRPRMALVARTLDFEGETADLCNGVKLGESTAYDSGKYSQEINRFQMTCLGSENSSEFDMHSGDSREVPQPQGQRNSSNSQYSSGESTSNDSQSRAFKPSSGEYSIDGTPENYRVRRYRYS